MSVHSMGRQGSSVLKLAIALHRLLGCQDERCETGKWLSQLQEGMLKKGEKNTQQSMFVHSNRTVRDLSTDRYFSPEAALFLHLFSQHPFPSNDSGSP